MPTEISNGTTVPHATDYSDLLAKLVTFAVSTGFWTVLQDDSEMTCLQGGGAGSDEIIVAAEKYTIVGTDTYGWNLNGFTGYQSGEAFLAQPGAIQASQVSGIGYPSLPLWNSSIPYWFVVNSRRIIVVAKISTTYQMCYLGFGLPFASPNQYPYPLMVGGSAERNSRFSGSGGLACMFWTWVSGAASNLMTRLADGSWYSTQNQVSGGSIGMYPYNMGGVGTLRQAIDDSAVLSPIEVHRYIITPTISRGRLMEFDGVYHVAGFGLSSEDIVTIAGEDYLIVQNVFRTGNDQYCAVRLV